MNVHDNWMWQSTTVEIIERGVEAQWSATWVLLPHLSHPSNKMNAPRFMWDLLGEGNARSV